MRLSGLLKWIGFMTVLALVYIHIQMNIISLAYQGRNKEKTIRSLKEENGYLTYAILSLKSANNIGVKLLSKDSGMDFVDPRNIVVLDTGENTETRIASNGDRTKDRNNLFVSLLSLGAQAEAQSR